MPEIETRSCNTTGSVLLTEVYEMITSSGEDSSFWADNDFVRRIQNNKTIILLKQDSLLKKYKNYTELPVLSTG